MLRDHYATIIAVAFWVVFALVATVWRNHVPPQQASLLGCATLVISCWAIARRSGNLRPRPGEGLVRLAPGERVTSADEVCQIMEAGMKGAALARDRGDSADELARRRGA